MPPTIAWALWVALCVWWGLRGTMTPIIAGLRSDSDGSEPTGADQVLGFLIPMLSGAVVAFAYGVYMASLLFVSAPSTADIEAARLKARVEHEYKLAAYNEAQRAAFDIRILKPTKFDAEEIANLQ